MKKIYRFALCIALLTVMTFGFAGCNEEAGDEIVLRINSWEEYIDEGDWDEEEAVDLQDDLVICPESSIVEDFEEWFYETYGKKVRVEYSTFGTNEELYNQMSMGDTYDLVCPSEYMIMKLMTEGKLKAFSEEFFDKTKEHNYYAKGLSPYIERVFEELSINNQSLKNYAAGYMWGTLGIVYNPEYVSHEEAAHWDLLLNEKYNRRITIKDSVRDAFFAGNSIHNYSMITQNEFVNSSDYAKRLSEMINATDKATVDAVEYILTRIKENVYSFETDSGKADMVSGKVVANQQWSGDAVYTLDQAEEDGVYLCYSAPEEATNLWFDGWCMLESGIDGDADKQMAAEAFVNFISRPDNVVRNMYYIGYTSVISGGEDSTVLDYINWTYGMDEETAAEEEVELVEYPIGYFFTGNMNETDEEYIIITSEDQTRRQLYAQYPTKEVMDRSVVMAYFDKEGNDRINQMWLNVRCFDIYSLFD